VFYQLSRASKSVLERSGAVDVCGVDAEKTKRKKNLVVAGSIRICSIRAHSACPAIS
jgi:hypothetical protein